TVWWPTSKNQFSPAPRKIARYVLPVSAKLPVVASTTTPLIRKASSSVSSGATSPPAFWRTRYRSTRRPALPARAPGRRSSGCFPLPAPGHRDPELLLRRRRRELADDLSFEHDEDPVGQPEHLVELERDEEDRPPLVALLDQPAVDELDRADVEAARRLRGDQHLRVAIDLAREDHLLLVAARELAGARQRTA